MNLRVDNKGKGNLRAQAAPRGASRIAPPPVKKEWKLRVPNINWRLTGRVSGLLLSVVALGLLLQAWQQWYPQLDRPIAQVLVESKLGQVSEQNQLQLQQQLDSFGTVGFLSVDLVAMQQALEWLPWVDQARISRIWPDQLKVEVVEQQPIARWGEEEWLNSRGQIFHGVTRVPEAFMPQLLGPAGTQEQVMQQYWSLSRLLRPMGYSIARLELRARGSWFVTTREGLEIRLGRDQVLEKMRRFAALYEHELREQMSRVARVDLRYANGLAVAWHDSETEAVQ